jgi:MarR family transcriptional regulator, organic hydroperoxide resistance regulator
MFDQCLYFNASALARLVEREWGVVYADLGLTPAQGYVLRVVLSAPGCLGSEIAQQLGIARPTATRLVDSLSKKKLVERRQGKSDAREWGVYPTRSGKALESTISDASAQISRRLKAKVGADVFASTIGGMRKIRKALR